MPPESMKYNWNTPITVFMGNKELKMTNNLTFELQREKASRPHLRKRMITRAKKLSHPRFYRRKNLNGIVTFQTRLNGELCKVGMPCLD